MLSFNQYFIEWLASYTIQGYLLFIINAIFICYSTMNDVPSKSVLSTVNNELNFI